MMKGTKRLAMSDSQPVVPNDSLIQSKRIMFGSAFDANRAEQSQQQAPLDMQRAELSRQHVRALNNQFVSWVQTQLQNHPDELWEDGVQDYLRHASSIMEKFTDVVDWLKANASRSEDLPRPGYLADQYKFSSESKESNTSKLIPDKAAVAPTSSTTTFGASWSTGIFSNNQTPFSFGIQNPVSGSHNAVSLNHNASHDADDEDDVQQPSSPSVKKAEEKGVTVVHEVKCKLYMKSSDPSDKDAWKDKGTGQLSIKCKEGVAKGTKESKPTIVVRNDVGKILLNALLYPGIKTNTQKNSIVAIFHTSGDGSDNDSVVARTFLIRTKTQEDRDKLAAVIQEYAPAA